MPQASDELRHQMDEYFGDPVDDSGPSTFLKNQGFKLNKDWTWDKPYANYKMSEKEERCILFLIEEWDFNGLS